MSAEDDYWQHLAFERVVDLLAVGRCGECAPPLPEIAAHIIHAVERPGTPIEPLSAASVEAADAKPGAPIPTLVDGPFIPGVDDEELT